MRAKRMKSDEVRRNWRDVLDYVRAGGTVTVEHYNRPVATITSYKEHPMTTTHTHTLTIVRGGQPNVNGENLGESVTLTDLDADVVDWLDRSGLDPDDPDVWVLVTPADQHPGELRNAIASRDVTVRNISVNDVRDDRQVGDDGS